MNFEPVHITWMAIFAMYFSCVGWTNYLNAKYGIKHNPLFSFTYTKPKKRVKNKASL